MGAIVVFIMCSLDIISGSIVALVNHEFTSSKFKAGCIRKFGQCAIVIASAPMQELCMQYYNVELPITIAVTSQFILQEGVSLYENFKKLGGENNND